MSIYVRLASSCYTVGVGTANNIGVARPFWERVVARMVELDMTQREVVERSGVAATTINGWRTGSRKPSARPIHLVADVLDIPRSEADRLAGLVPPARTGTSDDVRTAIMASAVYTDEQRDMLLKMVDLIEQANRWGGPDRATA